MLVRAAPFYPDCPDLIKAKIMITAEQLKDVQEREEALRRYL